MYRIIFCCSFFALLVCLLSPHLVIAEESTTEAGVSHFTSRIADAMANDSEIRAYCVNKKVADFDIVEFTDLPEAAYAAYIRSIACQTDSQIMMDTFKAISIEPFRLRLTPNHFVYEPNYATEGLESEILDVFLFGKKLAFVLAKCPNGRLDSRVFDQFDGKWFNAGNDRYRTHDEAEQKFLRLVEQCRSTNSYTITELITNLKKKEQLDSEQVLVNMRSDKEVRITAINKPVTNWSINQEQTDTPESLYAVVNLLLGSGSPDFVGRLDRYQFDTTRSSSPEELESLANMEKSFRDSLNAAVILETIIWRDHAIVIGHLPGEQIVSPFDVRWCRFNTEQRRWLNIGNDRLESVEDAERKFANYLATQVAASNK